MHAQLSLWLAAGEALMRRMLFIEAALIASEGAGDAHARRAARRDGQDAAGACVSPAREEKARRFIEHDPERPDAWRVSFKVFSSPAHGGSPERREGMGAIAVACGDASSMNWGGKTPAPPRAPGFRSAWPLAERAEALLRVFNDPAPYARRLAARLRRTARLAKRICTTSWDAFRDLVGHVLYDALAPAIVHAGAVFAENTS
jgi:hypothetical protein